MDEIAEMLVNIDKVQEGQNLSCNCTECYWNMYFPNKSLYDNESSKQCVSESLTEFKMTPNSTTCKGFWSYRDACGHKKGEKR